jgi:hypothetical protein
MLTVKMVLKIVLCHKKLTIPSKQAQDTHAAHETPETQNTQEDEHSKELQGSVPNARQANESPTNRKRPPYTRYTFIGSQ